VTPQRSTLSGRAVATRALPGLIAILLVAGGCIGGEQGAVSTAASSASAGSASPSAALVSPTLQPSPSASASVAATASPPSSASPSASPSGQSAELAVEACTGTDENRVFFLQASQNLDWPVYCPVLPARWFVANGNYSGRGVGQLVISYNGPSGATLSLQQGGFCETSDGCVPAGRDAGEASFGDQAGTLVALDDGGYAIVVGRADTPSWLAVGVGVDEAAFREIASSLVRLD